MLVGVPKGNQGPRVPGRPPPVGASALTAAGHRVRIQSGAGVRVGYSDAMYAAFGAEVVASADQVYAADMVVKVKEPQPGSSAFFGKG